MPTSDQLTAFYRKIFASQSQRRLSYAPADIARFKRDGLTPIRKDDGRVDVDDISEADVAGINEEIDRRNGGSGSSESRHIEHLTAMISDAQDIPREAALSWLLHTAAGQSLIRRTLGKRLQQKEKSMNYDSSQWQVIAKADPLWFVNAIEKGVNPQGDPFVLTNTAAKSAFPDLTAARAFARFVDQHPILQTFAFAKPDPFAYLKTAPLRKAAAEVVSVAPEFDGGSGDISDKAYATLMAMAEKLHKAGAYKTVAQAFSAMMQDDANKQLAVDAVLRSRARSGA
jgi:hypothetical protein